MNVKLLTKAFEENDKKAASPPTSPPRGRGGKPPLRISTLQSEEEILAAAASAAAEASSKAASVKASRVKSPPSGLFTPNSAHTFGRPNLSLAPPKDAGPQSSLSPVPALSTVTASPSTIVPTPTSSLPTPPDTAALATRRAERYIRDEQQLAAAATPDLPEFSPRVLQKFELAKAKALLTDRAATARARVVELREKLSRHDLDPQEHTALQQERWKQERWVETAEQQLARIEDAETALKEKRLSASEPEGLPIPSKDEAPVDESEARRRANLAKFFAQSPTHLTAHTRQRSRVMVLTSNPTSRESTWKLKLRDWPLGAALRRQSFANLRPRSLDGKERDTPPAAERLGHGSARKKSRRPPALPLTEEPSSGSGSASREWVYSAPAHTARFPPAPPLHVDYTLDEKRDGSAVVYTRTVLPTREEILAGAKPDAGPVAMPGYVSTLLDEFDFDIPDVVSALALPDPGPAPTRAPKPTRASTVRTSIARQSMATRASTTASMRLSSASPPVLPAHTPLAPFSFTLDRRASVDTLGSAVLVSRPSIDSYHYPRPKFSFRHLGGSNSTLSSGSGGEGSRVRKHSFLRPRTISTGPVEEGAGVMDRMRKRVSVLGKR